MEEKKVKKEEKQSEKTNDAPTYNDLKMYCSQLLSQNKELTVRLNTVMDIQNKLPYLFKVIEYSKQFPEDAVKLAKEEIISILGFYDENDSDETPSEKK